MNTANVWTTEDRRGGLPCVRNTRFTIAQLLTEIADRGSIDDVASAFNLDYDSVKGALEDVATLFDNWDIKSPSEEDI